ncbi:MAG: cobalamin-binding protein [Desulfuromonadales bacterium]|nr:cobalamin-binding protein [Desulfuromonadales bacterium]
MKKPLFLLLFSFLLVAPAHSRELIDQLGRKVEVAEPLTRVVSLIPSLTETSFEVGGGDVLVGVTRFATFPEAAARLPRVGSYIALDIERIVKLQPQLCLATKDGNPKAAVERLEALGIPVYVFDPKTLEEVVDTVVRLGDIYHTEARAETLVSGYRERLDRVARQLKGITEEPQVFFQIDAQPIFSAGSDTFLHQLLIRSGAINLAADRTGYPRYSWEELLVLKPDVVILASMGGGYSEQELKARWQVWPQIPAVKEERLYVVDADLFDRPSPRLIDALEHLVNLLHPEIQ